MHHLYCRKWLSFIYANLRLDSIVARHEWATMNSQPAMQIKCSLCRPTLCSSSTGKASINYKIKRLILT